MQLSEDHIALVEKNTSLLVVTPENSVFEALKEEFGEHTYFLNDEGLFVFMRDDEEAVTARLHAFAIWDEEDHSRLLQLIEPQNAGLLLDLATPELHESPSGRNTIH